MKLKGKIIATGDFQMGMWMVEDSSWEEENRLYINRGKGLSIEPMRSNHFPEIASFELTTKEAKYGVEG